MTYSRHEALKFINEFTPERLVKMWNQYKIWSFTTAYKLLRKSHDQNLSPLDAFCHAIAWTGDSAPSPHGSNERELIGFLQWDKVAGPTWNKAVARLKRELAKSREPAEALEECASVVADLFPGVSAQQLVSTFTRRPLDENEEVEME